MQHPNNETKYSTIRQQTISKHEMGRPITQRLTNNWREWILILWRSYYSWRWSP